MSASYQELQRGSRMYTEPGPVDFVEGEALYAVESILESRMVKGRREVLVK